RYGKDKGGRRIDWLELGYNNNVRSMRLISHSDRLEPDDIERFDAIALRNINPEAIAVFEGYTKPAVREDCRAIFSGLKLNSQVEKMLGRFCRQNELTNAVGVHVRRGDLIVDPNAIHRERAIELDEYFTALEKHPGCPIFLATDSRKVISAFRKNYGQRLLSAHGGIFFLSGFSRQSRRDVQYAFYELLLLSRCKSILAGPSNFSTAAALLGGKELQILVNKNMSQPWEEIRAIWGL
ncbi:MAG: hypothetical protein OEV26_00880, partial [Gallionella sp.]|nr:hypothetical protein [Gallionella sp.]